jgi:hypothetical protein
MSENIEDAPVRPYFKPEEIERLNKFMNRKWNLVITLQGEGKIPSACRIPRCHVQRRDLPMILGVSYSEAGRIIAYVREECKLKKRQYISIKNFCLATGLDTHEVQRSLDMCPMLHYWKDDPNRKN